MQQVTGVHPLADLFPMMSRQELEALADDIKANGLREKIKITNDGLIVDGRNRREACEIAEVEPAFEMVNGDAGALILSANIFRRHMTKAQIAILAICAELGITLPEIDSAPKAVDDDHLRGEKKYDYQRQAHKRVADLVSDSVIEHAAKVVRYAPDYARLVLDSGKDWNEARRVADERSKTANSEETRRRMLADDSPDLLAQVSDDGITLAEAWRLREARIRADYDKHVRHTGYLVDRVAPLLGKTHPKEIVEYYDPDLARRQIGIAEIDEAIEHLRTLRAEMKRQKKG